VTGDGRGDLITWNDNEILVSASNGTSFGTPLTAGPLAFWGDRANLIGDVTGDGKEDLVAWNADSVWVRPALAAGVGFGLPAHWTPPAPATPVFHGSTANLLGDVNGDGRADLVAWSATTVWVRLSTGSGFGAQESWTPDEPSTFYGSRANLIDDITGDGKADLVAWNDASIWVRRSTGYSFAAPAKYEEGATFWGSRANLIGDVR
jgi:hypothetical protein